jgi:hypothetical protein
MATNEPSRADYTSRLYTAQNLDVPNARLNPGNETVPPFATVQLSKGSYMTIYTTIEAFALRDAFGHAGDLLAGVTP